MKYSYQYRSGCRNSYLAFRASRSSSTLSPCHSRIVSFSFRSNQCFSKSCHSRQSYNYNRTWSTDSQEPRPRPRNRRICGRHYSNRHCRTLMKLKLPHPRDNGHCRRGHRPSKYFMRSVFHAGKERRTKIGLSPTISSGQGQTRRGSIYRQS